MKRKLILGLPALLWALCILLAVPARAADGLYRFMHNDHDALILGEVTGTDAAGVAIRALDYIVSARDLNESAPVKQLRPETVSLPADTRYMLYDTAETAAAGRPQEGDFVLASLNRTADGWKIAWGIYRASGDDAGTLSVLCAENASEGMRMEAAAVGAFVRSGGTMTEFSFDDAAGIVKSGEEVVYNAREAGSAGTAPGVSAGTTAPSAPASSAGADIREPAEGEKDRKKSLYSAAGLGVLVSLALLVSTVQRAKPKKPK